MARRKILVVDDDAPTRSLLQAVLEHNGHLCIPAGDSRTALEHLRAGDPDVILLDLLLPETDGFEILRQIKESRRALVPRTIVLTAAAERVWAMHDELDGVWCVLKKPVDIGELSEHIDDCIHQRHRDRDEASAQVEQPSPPRTHTN